MVGLGRAALCGSPESDNWVRCCAVLELFAINYLLRRAGRESAADISQLNAQAANASATLVRVRQEVLETGFRFNSRDVTLSVSATNNRVPVSAAFLDLILPENLIVQVDSEDGVRYVWNQSTNDWHSEQITNVTVIFDIPAFENLPHKFAVWIARQSAAEYWSEVNAGRQAPVQIIRDSLDARQKALNSTPPVDIRDNTGWRGRLRRFGRQPFDDTINRAGLLGG